MLLGALGSYTIALYRGVAWYESDIRV